MQFGQVSGQPASGQPVARQPVFGQPVFGQPILGQPVFGQSVEASRKRPRVFVPIHNSTMMDAAARGSPDVISGIRESFPDAQIDINTPDEEGIYPLMHAVKAPKEASKCIETFLTCFPDIDINLKDPDGQTALMLAAQTNIECLNTFLTLFPHIDLNLCDVNGRTALMHAVLSQNMKAILALLENLQNW